jgi:glycosyltransferase involved in cell wall biosynthesis
MIKDFLQQIRIRSRTATHETIRFSIGITTFEHRFEQYFIPLLNRIREYDRETEVIVAVNGEHKMKFSEEYRSRILAFTAQQPNVFPVLFPTFRGLSKLWNTIIIHSSNDYILLLNDDTMIEDARFLLEIAPAIAKSEGLSFVINRSWSHCVVNRREIDELGYFDERLLGIGEEDGDMIWRYLRAYGRPLKSFQLSGIVNFAEKTKNYIPTNIHCRPGMKYSQFNREFIFKEKYQKDPAGIKGMFDEPVSLKEPVKEQYPYERFFRARREEL